LVALISSAKNLINFLIVAFVIRAFLFNIFSSLA